ncbi:MAG TPA: hypothetical protein VGM56_33125 [Byssovorax sp.]|jgi:hypothetical protein
MGRISDYFKSKYVHTWAKGYGRHLTRVHERVDGPRHLLFAFCDHHEPLWNHVSDAVGDARVRFWTEAYPRLAAEFTDADGHHPRHSFFFPGEQYRAPWLEALAGFTKAGIGEVEFHLHHDGDTAATLRADLRRYLGLFAEHGHLARGPEGNELRFAFIHGNWCLANARADGKMCGVDAEIPLLFEEGCYADFTFPAAPDEAQPNVVNQIYWPVGDLAEKRAYEHAEEARVGHVKRDRILLVEGPLAVATRPERVPVYVENSAITARNPGNAARAATWVAQEIHVVGRPEWVFVKVHTHGAPEREAASLLGEPGRELHRALARYNDGEKWKLHYVTAREMFNVAIAAMEGREGDPNAFRDHVLAPPPAAG